MSKDLFPNCAGFPEIAASRLCPEVLRSAIDNHGSLVVRGLFGEKEATSLKTRVVAAIEGFDRNQPGYIPFGNEQWYDARPFLRKSGGVLAIDHPIAFNEYLEALEEQGIPELIETFFGEPPAILGQKTVFRCIEKHIVVPEWHQDGAFMGRNIDSLNLWVSLSDCGEKAPSLDLIGTRFRDLLPTGTEGAFFPWGISHGEAMRSCDGRFRRLHFMPGDAIFFDHLTVHRTGGAGPLMSEDRYAIESWFLAPSTYPFMGRGKGDQKPILLQQSRGFCG